MMQKYSYLKSLPVTIIAICFFAHYSVVSAAGTLTTSGLIFNGDSSANISRTNATRVQVPENLINPTQGWVAVRMKMGFASTASFSSDPIIWDMSASDPADLFVYFDESSDQFHLARASKIGGKIFAPSTQPFASGTFKTIIASWTVTTLNVSVDGGAFQSTSETVIPPQAPFLIGSTLVQGSGRQPNSDYYWVAAGTGTLTNTDAATINSFGNSDRARSNFPGLATFIWWANDTQYNNDTSGSPTVTPVNTLTNTPTLKPTSTLTPTFKPSVTITPNPTIFRKPGDANGDGKVDGVDFVIWVQNYSRVTSLGAIDGDFNADTHVNGIDYVIWLTNYSP